MEREFSCLQQGYCKLQYAYFMGLAATFPLHIHITAFNKVPACRSRYMWSNKGVEYVFLFVSRRWQLQWISTAVNVTVKSLFPKSHIPLVLLDPLLLSSCRSPRAARQPPQPLAALSGSTGSFSYTWIHLEQRSPDSLPVNRYNETITIRSTFSFQYQTRGRRERRRQERLISSRGLLTCIFVYFFCLHSSSSTSPLHLILTCIALACEGQLLHC